MQAGERKTRDAVVEGCRVPSSSRVARRAIRRSEGRSGRRMYRVVRSLPSSQMALRVPAIGCSDHQAVIVVDVAKIAGHVGMPVGQRETRGGVTEHARGPRRDRMASSARGCRRRKSSRDVIRHRAANRGGALEGRLVAAVAVRRIQRVIVADVAGRTGSGRRRHVRAGQRKSGDAVVERGRRPPRSGMARRAIGSSKCRSGSRVDRRRGSLPGGQVALRIAAIRGGNGQRIIVINVAERTGHVGVAIGQQEAGAAVVKCGRRPAHRVMAGRAISNRESRSGRRVNGIVGLLPVGQVAL